jgi:diamine N-acetyltransferase
MNNELDIFLRPPEIRDVNLLHLWENNLEFSQFSSLGQSYSAKDIESFIRSNKEIRENKQFRLMICVRESKECIGTVDLYAIDFSEKDAGVGVLIADKSYRRKGVAKQALALIADFSRKRLGLRSLYCEIEVSNTPSISLFENAGYGSKSLRKSEHIIDTVPVDVYFYRKNI